MSANHSIKGVKRITVLGADSSGAHAPVQVFKEKKGTKKGSRGLRGVEKLARRMLDAQSTMSSNLLDRHKRSNRKRRDGWLRDLAVNSVRAHRKGMKRLKLNRWL